MMDGSSEATGEERAQGLAEQVHADDPAASGAEKDDQVRERLSETREADTDPEATEASRDAD